MIEILDPVAGLEYILDTENHMAHRHRYTVQPETASRTLPASSRGSAIGAARNRTAGSTGATVLGGLREATTTVGVVPALQMQDTPESLGTQLIEGVLAEGTRRTFTYPSGSVGNDRPFSATQEIWTSPELKIMVLSKNDDPRSGESVTRLINISRSEPDAALFQPPPDFQVVDDTGAVKITFTRP
jgi:hypothetical protein